MSQNFYFSHFLFSSGDFDVKKCEKATGEFSTPRTEDLDLRCTVMRIVVNWSLCQKLIPRLMTYEYVEIEDSTQGNFVFF